MATDYIKTVQTRLTRKGTRLSKSQIREVYNQVITTPESPSEDELNVVMQQLEAQYKAPSHEPTSGLTATEQPALTQQEEVKEMSYSTPAQPAQEPSNGALATSVQKGLSRGCESDTAPTQTQIIEAVEQQFGKENFETKTAILNYVLNDTYATATELKAALAKLRQMRLDLLLKLIADHNQASASDENQIKTALLQASSARQKETEDFFASFDARLLQMRTNFGI
ncbi:MAG TPA: hypothetical protein V6C85_15420 [Allocoleopsis sp.]